MNKYSLFEKRHGPAIQCTAADLDTLSQYQKKLPNSLLYLWEQHGWCAYAEGLIWVVNPNSMTDLLDDWIDYSDDQPIVIARTAFADIFFWGQDGVHFLNVHYGRVTRVCNHIEEFFNDFLCKKKNINGILRYELFRAIVSKLGIQNPDECYAFVPALALGGTGNIDSIKKVSMREHLGILAQIVIE